MIVKKRVCDECMTELSHPQVTVRATVVPPTGKKKIVAFDYCMEHGKEVIMKLKEKRDERVKNTQDSK